MSDEHDALRTHIDATRRKPGGDAEAATLPQASESRELASDRFGRYGNVHEIARGGMGAILSGHDPAANREVAIKVLLGDAYEEMVSKFMAEAQVTAQLVHPNIVPVYEVGRSHDGDPYFTMMRVRGESLAALCKTERDAATDDWQGTVLLRFLKICDAVAFAHDREVVHRDLKPENVMVGPFGEVLVMDWGLARLMSDTCKPNTVSLDFTATSTARLPMQTLDGAISGTPAYMAPEQARGDVDRIGPWTDIYSLGAILYELLALVPPFQGKSVSAILEAVERGELVPPSERAPERRIPRELEAVVLQAMARKRKDRYGSVQALQSDIRAYLEGHTLSAARYSPAQRLWKWTVRNKAVVGSIAAILAAVLVVGSYFQRKAAADRQARIDGALAAVKTDLARLKRHRGLLTLAREAEAVDIADRRQAREAALAAHLDACTSLERAIQVSGAARLQALRRQTGEALGVLATFSGDYTLAEHAFRELSAYGMNEQDRAKWIARVRRFREQVLLARRERIASILAGIARNQLPEGWSIDDVVFQVAGYRDRQTVELLAAALRPIEERARRDGAEEDWTPADQLLVRFACRVLGRLERRDSVSPLAQLAAVIDRTELVVEAGRALCLTRSAEAHQPLLELRFRLKSNHAAWSQIAPLFRRVPEPVHTGDKQVVEVTPREAAMMLADLAQRRLTRGELPRALNKIREAIALDASIADLHRLHGKILTRQGKLREALRAFDRGVACAPNRVLPHLSRAMARFNLRDFDGAWKDVQRAAKLDPDDPEMLNQRARLWIEKDKPEMAIADCTRAIELKPGTYSSYSTRPIAYRETDQLKKALADANTAIGLRPELSSAYANRAEIQLLLGKAQLALTDAQRAVEIDQDRAHHYDLRGRVRMALYQHRDAEHDFSHYIRLKPNSPLGLLRRGTARRSQRKWLAAVDDYSAAIKLDARIGDCWRGRARVRMDLRQFSEALADIDHAVQLEPDHAWSHMWRGHVLTKLRRYREAIVSLDRAIALEPKFAYAYSRRGKARRLAGDLQGAKADFDRAVTLDPDDSLCYHDRGQFRGAIKDYAGAIADYTAALKHLPRGEHGRRAELLLDRGNAWLRQGKNDPAMKDYREALTEDETLWQAWFSLGVAYGRSGRTDKAIEALEQALKYAKGRPEAKGIARLLDQAKKGRVK